jgi:hypothetical protein
MDRDQLVVVVLAFIFATLSVTYYWDVEKYERVTDRMVRVLKP